MAAPIDEPLMRYRLNLVDHLALTDLRFSYPNEDFHLQAWWTAEVEAHGKGDTRVVLYAQPHTGDELLRLTLKSNSEVEHTPDGGLVIRLYVDRWGWLIPLVSSYGGDVLIEEPRELRDAVITHFAGGLMPTRLLRRSIWKRSPLASATMTRACGRPVAAPSRSD